MLVEKHMNIDFEPFQRCQDARVRDAHKIAKRDLSDSDLTMKFREDCKELLKTLRGIESYLM